jgi:hypothetical protein
MKNLKLPLELQNNVRGFMFSNQSSLEAQSELDEFIDLISKSHRTRVMKEKFMVVLNNKFFRVFSDVFKKKMF